MYNTEAFSMERDAELVQTIYRQFHEDSRLTHSKAAQVEFLTTVRYIERYLKTGDRILDLGAGAGEYSLYFAEQGWDVTAVELADENIRAFQQKIRSEMALELVQGNAMDLSRYADASFDMVLLFGPLYHLHREQDQLQCIAEAKRVCKQEGTILFAFISNDMIILTEFLRDASYFTTGDYDKKTFRLEDFPFVFHTVDRCRSLLQTSGIRILHEVAADGISELLEEQINALDEAGYAQFLRYHAYICEKPEFLGMSNHLLFVGKKE